MVGGEGISILEFRASKPNTWPFFPKNLRDCFFHPERCRRASQRRGGVLNFTELPMPIDALAGRLRGPPPINHKRRNATPQRSSKRAWDGINVVLATETIVAGKRSSQSTGD
jgi:hypothetical protein